LSALDKFQLKILRGLVIVGRHGNSLISPLDPSDALRLRL